MKSTVSIRKCGDYDPARVTAVLHAVTDDLGGLGSFVKRGDRVLLKPNLLKSAGPEEAVVTHPAFVEAVGCMAKDCGAELFLGDSPPLGKLARVASKSGYDPFMKKLNIRMVPFSEKTTVEFPDRRLFRRLDLAKEIFDFDLVVNLPKLKTHCQMVLTLAVKNLFGAIVGSDKAGWHLRAGKDFDSFATVLVQIYEKIRPGISIVDGILGMEGNGPNAGVPRRVGVIAASSDAVALDAEVCRLVGFPLESLRTCVIAQNLGLGTAERGMIERVGDELNGFPLTDFKAPKSMTMAWNLSSRNPIRKFLENHLITKPDIDASSCKNCGICMKHCPPQAISERKGVMVVDRGKCISCFCCHELCSNEAIRIVQPFLGRCISAISR
ncbi:MAG: DUF362 domain-containing protein [Desulfomonilaceae bacterium]|nr:DUF362 domain-containing protein [Desulfomonilaceae bacterium]